MSADGRGKRKGEGEGEALTNPGLSEHHLRVAVSHRFALVQCGLVLIFVHTCLAYVLKTCDPGLFVPKRVRYEVLALLNDEFRPLVSIMIIIIILFRGINDQLEARPLHILHRAIDGTYRHIADMCGDLRVWNIDEWNGAKAHRTKSTLLAHSGMPLRRGT